MWQENNWSKDEAAFCAGWYVFCLQAWRFWAQRGARNSAEGTSCPLLQSLLSGFPGTQDSPAVLTKQDLSCGSSVALSDHILCALELCHSLAMSFPKEVPSLCTWSFFILINPWLSSGNSLPLATLSPSQVDLPLCMEAGKCPPSASGRICLWKPPAWTHHQIRSAPFLLVIILFSTSLWPTPEVMPWTSSLYLTSPSESQFQVLGLPLTTHFPAHSHYSTTAPANHSPLAPSVYKPCHLSTCFWCGLCSSSIYISYHLCLVLRGLSCSGGDVPGVLLARLQVSIHLAACSLIPACLQCHCHPI